MSFLHAAFAIGLALAGCAAPLPVYSRRTPRESLDTIADRLSSVRSVSARCELTLTNERGDSIRLDGALAAEIPDYLRLRAWKFGRVAFDFTLAPDGAWLLAPEDPRADAFAPGLPVDKLRQAFSLVGPGFFRAAEPVASQSTESRLVVSGPGDDQNGVICEIDRPTLTPRRVLVTRTRDGSGSATLEFGRYLMIDGFAWPTLVRLRSDAGEVLLRFTDTEINTPIARGAFTPPARATPLP